MPIISHVSGLRHLTTQHSLRHHATTRATHDWQLARQDAARAAAPRGETSTPDPEPRRERRCFLSGK
eukprot:1487468-Prymnesium_polylepis.1